MIGVSEVVLVLKDVVTGFFYYIFIFLKWFYLHFLPFIVIYIGIPLFIIGVLLGLSFGGGTVLFLVVFSVGLYYFINNAIFKSDPYKIDINSTGPISANQKIFKSNF